MARNGHFHTISAHERPDPESVDGTIGNPENEARNDFHDAFTRMPNHHGSKKNPKQLKINNSQILVGSKMNYSPGMTTDIQDESSALR
ncbi:MAG: hypothetical protein KDN22_02250 [Verrucomicrobiae bacterium]|nr:hypothetical protein [Verrucomicrobiae bacterium]